MGCTSANRISHACVSAVAVAVVLAVGVWVACPAIGVVTLVSVGELGGVVAEGGGTVEVAVEVAVAVAVATGVAVDVAIAVKVGMAVGVAVAVGVLVAVEIAGSLEGTVAIAVAVEGGSIEPGTPWVAEVPQSVKRAPAIGTNSHS